MKTTKITIAVFSMLVAFACNTQQSKKTNDNISSTQKLTFEKSIIKKIDKTDEKALIKNIDKTEQKGLNPCEYLVKEILTTSPRFKQLTKGLYEAVIKNGGQYCGISLEGSPNPRQDNAWSYSKTYDFTVYEMYSDRQLNTARFSFNPNNKQLYEYDAIHDQLKSIEFDKSLLLKYDSLCK